MGGGGLRGGDWTEGGVEGWRALRGFREVVGVFCFREGLGYFFFLGGGGVWEGFGRGLGLFLVSFGRFWGFWWGVEGGEFRVHASSITLNPKP